MKLLGRNCYIKQPSFSRNYHIFVKFDSTTFSLRSRLAYEIGVEYNLIAYDCGCLYVKWDSFLEAYKFKGWNYSTAFVSFPDFKSESEAKRFIDLLNTHCLIQVK